MGNCLCAQTPRREQSAEGPISIHSQREGNRWASKQKIHSWGPQGPRRNLPTTFLEQKNIFDIRKRGAVLGGPRLWGRLTRNAAPTAAPSTHVSPGCPCPSPTGSPAQRSALWPSVQGSPPEPPLGTLPWGFPTGPACKCNGKVLLISGHKSSDLVLLQPKGLPRITPPTRTELPPVRAMIWSRK